MPASPRLPRAAGAVASTAALAVLLTALPARAAGTVLHVDVQSTLGGLSVCASGSAPVPGTFQLSIEGARSNGSRISEPASGPNRLTYYVCRTVEKLGTSSGAFGVVFTFTSGVDNTSDDSACGAGAWMVGFNDLAIGSGG